MTQTRRMSISIGSDDFFGKAKCMVMTLTLPSQSLRIISVFGCRPDHFGTLPKDSLIVYSDQLNKD